MENNFKNLHRDKIDYFEKNSSEKVESNIKGNLSFFKLIGNFFELFLPRQFTTLSKMFDGGVDKNAIDTQKKPGRYPKI